MASATPLHCLPQHSSISHFTPVFLLFLLSAPAISTAVNVTAVLSAHPDFSAFTRLLSASGVAGELTARSSLTLLAVPDPSLLRSDLPLSNAGDLADVIRYHVLLHYLSPADVTNIPPAGELVTTLYQTTGRAAGVLGSVNLTRDVTTGSVTARSPVPSSASNATVLSRIYSLPYTFTILAVDALVVPYGFDLAASESRPRPERLNITRVLVDGKDFNVAVSMLEASGVVEEFEDDESGAGITIFVPTDEAFGALPATDRLQSLPADRKATVLRFHVLHSYYPLGSLQSIVNPVEPTLATEDVGAGRFTLNISRANGSVAIDTGVVRASITRTVFDQNPVAVFAVSRVLLPKEIFGKEVSPVVEKSVPPPDLAPEVASPPGVSSPPALIGDLESSGLGGRGGNFICTRILLYLVLLPLV